MSYNKIKNTIKRLNTKQRKFKLNKHTRNNNRELFENNSDYCYFDYNYSSFDY